MPAFSLLAKPGKLEVAYPIPSSPPSKPAAPARRTAPPPQRKKLAAANPDPPLDHQSTSVPIASQRSKRQPVSAQPVKSPSTVVTTTTPSSLNCTVDPLGTLSLLGDIIADEVTHWAYHTGVTSTVVHYTTLSTDSTLSTATSAKVKSQALQHILETLPLRYKALALAYSDSELLEPVVLSAELEALLESVQHEDERGIEEQLKGWYDQKLFQSKKFRPDILNMDEEVRRLEETRMEELQGLMLMVEEMKLAATEGLVGDEVLKILIETMDEAGLNAAGMGSTRAAINDSWVWKK